MNANVAWLSRFLWVVCAFHVLIGLSLNVDLGLKEWVGSSLYNAQVDWSDGQFNYIMKPLGAFMIALGIMAALAARDPLGNRPIIIGFVALFTMRALQRVVFMTEIESVFGIPASRSMVQMVVMLSMAVALLLLLRAASADPGIRAVSAA